MRRAPGFGGIGRCLRSKTAAAGECDRCGGGCCGRASAPTLFCRVARNCMATWAKSVGAEAPPTTAASHNSRLRQGSPAGLTPSRARS
nr:DUF6053 domain-containing protein [Lysobacter enzymogenes]